MAKEFVRNIKETKLRGKNIEPLYTNEQNDLLSDKKHAYIRNNDYYFPLTQAILDLVASNEDGKNPVKPKLNIDGKENTATLEWDTKALGNNFVEETPITIKVDDEFNQIKIGIDDEALYRFIKPYFISSKDITVDFDDEKQTISYRLNDEAFFERLVSHFKDGNGLDFVIDNEFKTVHYNLKDDKIKSIIFETVQPKDDDLAVEQKDGKLLIDLSDKNTKLLKDHTESIKTLKTRVENAMKNIAAIGDELGRKSPSAETVSSDIEELKTRVDNAMKNIAALSGEVNRKAQSGENSSSEIETLKTSVDNAMKNIAAISDELGRNAQYNKDLAEYIETYRKKTENNENEILKLQTDVGRHDETINAITEELGNFTGLEIFEDVINKYDQQNVRKRTLNQYITDFKEDYPNDETPSFYELQIMDEILTGGKSTKSRRKELLLFIVDSHSNTYVLNTTKMDNEGRMINLTDQKKDYLDKYSKKLLSLKIKPEDDTFVTAFNLADPQKVIYDLYTINNLNSI